MELDYEIRMGYGIQSDWRTKLNCTRHLHHEIEIVYMIDGETEVEVDSKKYIMKSGDVLITFPNQIHSYDDLRENKSVITIFPPDICPEYSLILKKKVPVLSCLPAGDKGNDILAVFKELIALKSAGQLNHTRYSQQMSKGYILILLGMLFDLLTLSDSKDSNTDALKSILIFCHENYTREISLDIVARNLHMNKYYVSHLFNGKLKISLSDYINKLRITDACRFLTETTDCITKIAYKSGFSSLRSFNRHFQRITGFTPMNYRKAYQNEKGAS